MMPKVLRTSFETAKRLRAMMGILSTLMIKSSGLVCTSGTQDDLQKQAILAYANLCSPTISLAICRKTSCFRRVCLVMVAHNDGEIKTNWQNAIKEVSTRNQTTPSSV
jgi:hypothetical protein